MKLTKIVLLKLWGYINMKYLSNYIGTMFGEYYKHKFELWLKEKRLRRAKELAMLMHEQHNGMRFWVLELDHKPGYYQVWSWPQIKAGIKCGTFSDRATLMDFLREAAWYTPVGTKLILEKRKERNIKHYILFGVVTAILITSLIISLLI